MENHEQNIDDLFRDALNDYSETPPPAVWNSLESKLAKVPRANGFSDRSIWYGLLSLLLLPGVSGVRRIWYVVLPIVLLLSIPAVKLITGKSDSAGNVAANNNKPNNTAINSTPNNPNVAKNTTNDNFPPPSSNNPAAGDNQNLIANNIPVTENRTNGKSKTTFEKTKTNKTTATLKHNTGRLTVGNNNQTGNKTGESTPEQDVYNSNQSNPSPAEENASGNDTKVGRKDEATSLSKNAKLNQKVADSRKPDLIPKVKFGRFEAGIKLGFERGFDNETGKKAVVSPYLQYNFSPKLSIMTQPAIKFASLDARTIGNQKTYYKENGDSAAAPIGPSTPVYITESEIAFYLTPYKYSQSHDSIIKSSIVGGSYTEFELPLLLKYAVSKTFSVYGGLNLVFSKTIAIKENTTAYNNIVVTDSPVSVISPTKNPTPGPTSSFITYSGTDISKYPGPQFPTSQTDQLRFGYMLGFSYEFYKRWLFDALVQQSGIKPNIEGGYNVNSTLSEPYFRFTIGYKLTK